MFSSVGSTFPTKKFLKAEANVGRGSSSYAVILWSLSQRSPVDEPFERLNSYSRLSGSFVVKAYGGLLLTTSFIQILLIVSCAACAPLGLRMVLSGGPLIVSIIVNYRDKYDKIIMRTIIII